MKETIAAINGMQRAGVIEKYAIGGAVGATFYLEPAATLDVDIFVIVRESPPDGLISLSPIYEHLADRGYKTQAEHVMIGGWPVQFLPPADALETEAVMAAMPTEIAGEKTWVMQAEHLVAIALRTGRPKDFNRILQFLEQKAVDTDRLRPILAKHGLTEQWRKFEKRYLNE